MGNAVYLILAAIDQAVNLLSPSRLKLCDQRRLTCDIRPNSTSVGATPSRRLECGCPPLVSQDIECDSVLCVLLLVVLSRSPWSPFSTARVKRRGKTGRGPDARESVCSVHTSMVPRRHPREGVAEQTTRPEVGDAPPPQQTQPLPQDAHSGIVPPPPPPPQVTQGLDMTHFLEGMAQFVAQHRDAPVPQGGTGRVLREFLQFQPPQFLGQPDPDVVRAWLDAVERTFRSMECVPEERQFLKVHTESIDRRASCCRQQPISKTLESPLYVAVDRPIACCRQMHTELKFYFWKPAPVDSKLVPVD
ncbi:hypothetical protein Taro_021946, partial [Colocasia esculenta]|nr:hypothetical protein [Colocasia esculenta]